MIPVMKANTSDGIVNLGFAGSLFSTLCSKNPPARKNNITASVA